MRGSNEQEQETRNKKKKIIPIDLAGPIHEPIPSIEQETENEGGDENEMRKERKNGNAMWLINARKGVRDGAERHTLAPQGL